MSGKNSCQLLIGCNLRIFKVYIGTLTNQQSKESLINRRGSIYFQITNRMSASIQYKLFGNRGLYRLPVYTLQINIILYLGIDRLTIFEFLSESYQVARCRHGIRVLLQEESHCTFLLIDCKIVGNQFQTENVFL